MPKTRMYWDSDKLFLKTSTSSLLLIAMSAIQYIVGLRSFKFIHLVITTHFY